MFLGNWLYRLATSAYFGGIRLAAFWSDKARARTDGAAHERTDAQREAARGRRRVWVHCASLGEFEQGRPLIEAMKADNPDIWLLLTFFSPSGYDIRKHYPHADEVRYLPNDTPSKARAFLSDIQPDLVVFVKYEFWFYHLREVSQRGVPLLLVSAVFKPDSWFFGRWGAWPRQMLGMFSQIFVQDAASQQLLEANGFVRVLQLVATAPENDLAAAFVRGARQVVVCGSTWPPDEDLLVPEIKSNSETKWIVAPHEVDAAHVQGIVAKLEGVRCIRYSEASGAGLSAAQVLIVDNIGLLASLYRYGQVAYIGGGFGKGIHNTLEPAAWGMPVIFGPKYRKFEEANMLVSSGGAFAVSNGLQLTQVLNHLSTEEARLQSQRAIAAFFEANRGATGTILRYLKSHELL
jgi:3-deoxy-D-manno-octulosonic-acid transferase